MYNISNYSFNQAKKLGVEIKPSSRKGKKIDVFKNGDKVASIGAIGYKDYPTYMKEDKRLAEQKRKAYKARHKIDRTIKGSAGYYADKILW
jgi:uncharacterized membrane protein YebE (DUF533 family)